MREELFERAFEEESFEGGYVPNRFSLFDEVASTNDEIVKLAEKGAPEGSLVIAARQTQGQGRSGRSFYSPAGGNLYMSFLLRPSSFVRTQLLTPAAAVATVRAIKKVCSIDTKIKWVNDIYLDDKKVSGMIAKAFDIHDRNKMYVVIGIGINVHPSDEAVPEDIPAYGTLYKDKITSDDDQIIPKLAATLYSEYMKIYTDIEDPDFMEEYKNKSNCMGKEVYYICGDKQMPARVININPDGSIVLEDENGQVKSYCDGEVRIITNQI